jgi:methylglyoxal/glyoxal reductase
MIITDIKGTFTLSNGVKMPYFGLGVFQVGDGEEVINAVTDALNLVYAIGKHKNP